MRVLRLVVSHTYLYKKLDQYGQNHNAKILDKVQAESARMLQLWEKENTVITGQSITPADSGRKIVFDNFDFIQKVHHMTETHQNTDNH